jgi:hypothetical protein
MRCGVCAVALSGKLVTCRDCDLEYHADCWSYNRGCAIYGCRRPPVKARARRTVCPMVDIEPPPDRRRGTLALMCMAAAFVLAEVYVEKHTGGCCPTPMRVGIAINILVVTSWFFTLVGLALDRPMGRAVAAFVIQGVVFLPYFIR